MRRLCNKKLRFIFRRADSLIFAEDRGKIGGVFVAYCLRNLISEQVCILEKLLCLADPFLIDVLSKRTGGGFLEGTAQMGREMCSSWAITSRERFPARFWEI